MLQQNSKYKYPLNFLTLYAILYMSFSVYGTYISVYFKDIGFSNTDIGALLALGPLAATVAQPIWGMAGDRARTKNSVLFIMLIGSAISILLFPLTKNIYSLFIIVAVFTFFQTSQTPLTDAMTLEFLEGTQWKFGSIRMAGTISFAAMSVIAGLFVKNNTKNIFFIYFVIIIFTIICVFFLPKIKGHQTKHNKVSALLVFKDKKLILLMCLNFAVMLSLSYFNGFFPIYFKSLGASNQMVGNSMFIVAFSEIPFLLNADKIISRLSLNTTMILATVVLAVRWFLISMVTDIYLLLLCNILSGFGYIVLFYCMATYINNNVAKELKASGQTMNALVSVGLSRIVGSLAGGVISDGIGIKHTFLAIAIFTFAVAIIFTIIFNRQKEDTSISI